MTDSCSYSERAYYSAEETRALRETSFFRGYVCALVVMLMIALGSYLCNVRITLKENVYAHSVGCVQDR